MKYSVILVTIFYLVSYSSLYNIWEIEDLKAVTRFDEIEEYYRRLRVRKRETRPDNEPTGSIKRNICQNICASHYFRMELKKEWINVDDSEIREELARAEYNEIFDSVFVESARNWLSWLPFRRYERHDYDYENAYKRRKVLYDDRIDATSDDYEWVFVCLARDQRSRKIERYFVSREYDVNLVEMNAKPMAGRFIFTLSAPSDELRILAMAEEPAVEYDALRRSPAMAASLLLVRACDPPTETPNQDPVCRLSIANKLRLCTALFSARVFMHQQITFSPTVEHVLADCEHEVVQAASNSWLMVAFSNLVYRIPATGDVVYNDWMIGCRAHNHTGQPVVYYVSRGNLRNTIFVYRKANDDRVAFFHSYFYNVSVSYGNEKVFFLRQDVED